MAFAVDTYQRKRRNKTDWSAPEDDLDAFVKQSCDILEDAGKPYNISINHGNWGPNRTLPFIRRRLRAVLLSEEPGTPIAIAAQKGDDIIAFSFRRVHRPINPANTVGSPDMDLIHAAIFNEFGAKRGWGLFSVGLYVQKPGEHGAVGYADGKKWMGNAEDYEFADSTQDTPQSCERLDIMAKWAVAQANNGLPIGGVISQGMAWSVFYNGWEPYKSGYDRFTRHFTHVHVSGAAHDRLSGWF
jgi:hypothetical protein